MSEKIYTARVKAVKGRNGHVESDDGVLKLDLASPGAASKAGATNPEQLFACGYAACFGSAVEVKAKAEKVAADNVTVDAEVTLNKDDSGFFLNVLLSVTLPGVAGDVAEKIVQEAHKICPYSKATRGNIKVDIKVNDQNLKIAA